MKYLVELEVGQVTLGLQQHKDTSTMNRVEAARVVSKVFAYLACNKRDEARAWAQRLIDWLTTI